MSTIPFHIRSSLLVAGIAACIATAGCGGSIEPVQTYAVDRLPDTHRIDAAIIQGEQETWFIKMTGVLQQSSEAEQKFATMVESLQWPEGAARPQWSVPEGWTEKPPADRMTFATLDTGPAGPEVAITRLPNNPRLTSRQYLMLNLNRWRKQLGLPPVDETQMLEQSRPLASGEGLVVSLAGRLPAKPQSSSPTPLADSFAMPATTSPTDRPSPSPTGQPRPESPITFTRPEGWQDGGAAAFSVASLRIESENGSARVTVSAAGGDLVENVNRWRGQVGLEAWTPAEVLAEGKPIKVDRFDGTLFRLDGSEQSIIGVIAPGDDTTWFIKFTGDASLAAEQYDAFVKFVESIAIRR